MAGYAVIHTITTLMTPWWQIALEAATALGTVGAAVAAVWIGVVRESLKRPRLSLHCDPTDIVALETEHGDYRWKVWARLRVQSESGRHAAEDVEVAIVTARATEASGDSEVLKIDGMLLGWSNTRQYFRGRSGNDSRPDKEPDTRTHVPPGVFRHVDILSIGADMKLGFEVVPAPSDARNKTDRAEVGLELAVSARNTDAAQFSVTVFYRPVWPNFPHDLERHLQIEVMAVKRSLRWPKVDGLFGTKDALE